MSTEATFLPGHERVPPTGGSARREVEWQRTTRRDGRQEATSARPRTVPDAQRARRSGLVGTRLQRTQASRTFLATAIPIAARMRMMSNFFIGTPLQSRR